MENNQDNKPTKATENKAAIIIAVIVIAVILIIIFANMGGSGKAVKGDGKCDICGKPDWHGTDMCEKHFNEFWKSLGAIQPINGKFQSFIITIPSFENDISSLEFAVK